MGRYNSSATRVVPVFDRLFDRDVTGQHWLPYLLSIGSRAASARVPDTPGRLIPDHPRWWGSSERRLPAPESLLSWLISNISEDQVHAANDPEPVYARRLALARKDPAALSEAKLGLKSGARNRKWYVLEGGSSPDAFLETDQLVLVVEGKRTERSCTTKTKWMPRRSQLLRHMDAALELAGARHVLGILIIEGPVSNPFDPGPFWSGQADAQVSSEMLSRSLPHRSPEDRRRIADGVLGAATWQRICRDCNLPWPPENDTRSSLRAV